LSADDQAGPSWKRGGGIAQPQQTIVPYEWFEQVSRRIRGDQKQILILWLNEEIFRGKPLRNSGLKRFLYAARTTSADNKFKLIGPYSSATLRDMVSETRKFIYAPPYDQSFGELRENDAWPDLKDVQFYAYGATMADDQLLGDLAGANGTVQRFFESSGLHLQRTISTERAVARGIVSELRRRKVGLGSTGGDIVLISEWDTYYGQSLLEAVELAFGHTRPGDDRQRRNGRKSDWIHKLTYLRGLDGVFPEKALGENQADTTNSFKIKSDEKSFDWPMGQSQYDYLRRMSEQLHKLDKDLRREKRGIKAFGVLGSDVFDKLLVLRALRPQFPEAVFFTTDLDEAFTMGSEITWTRNLVVSSSFGLSLHKSIQREIPAFRGSYQTSAFLATLLAIGDPAKDWTTPSAVSDYISGQLLVSRIFEIERSGNVLSLARDKLPLHVASPIITAGNTRLARRILKNATHPDSLPILAASRRDVLRS
jgi:hypothetical protein